MRVLRMERQQKVSAARTKGNSVHLIGGMDSKVAITITIIKSNQEMATHPHLYLFALYLKERKYEL